MEICGLDDLFCLVLTCFWAEKWTSADLMTFFLGGGEAKKWTPAYMISTKINVSFNELWPEQSI